MSYTFHLPAKASLVVASDIHIRRPHDERAQSLLNLIDTATKNNVKIFVLNGDIFDFFFGWGVYFKNLYAEIFYRLEILASTGCRVIFVEGNHEFGLDKMKVNGVEFLDGFGGIIAVDNVKIQIVHGDLMKFDWKYFAFRRFIRSRLTNMIAAIVPQNLLDRFTLWFASTSRKKDRYRTLNHEHILGNAKALLRQSHADHLVFGHFHHPYDETFELAGNKKHRIVSVSSWDKPSCLCFIDGEFTRVELKLT